MYTTMSNRYICVCTAWAHVSIWLIKWNRAEPSPCIFSTQKKKTKIYALNIFLAYNSVVTFQNAWLCLVWQGKREKGGNERKTETLVRACTRVCRWTMKTVVVCVIEYDEWILTDWCKRDIRIILCSGFRMDGGLIKIHLMLWCTTNGKGGGGGEERVWRKCRMANEAIRQPNILPSTNSFSSFIESTHNWENCYESATSHHSNM